MNMRGFFAGVFFSFAIILFYFGAIGHEGGRCTEAQTLFSPNSQPEVESLVRTAKNSIELEMYVFTSEQMALELAEAARRGVEVRVILERRVNSYNMEDIVSALRESGVKVRWASLNYKLTHSKMMVVDGKRVFVGSTNFSKSALNQNREMAVVLEGEIVKEFISEFEKDWEMAKAE